MRRRSTALLLALLLAGSARADTLVNDRSADPPGTQQSWPRVTTVQNFDTIGEMVVALWWLPGGSGTNRFRYAVAPQSATAFTNGGAPPAPAGWLWLGDPVVHGEAFDESGIFYLAGTVRTSGGATPSVGYGFARGIVSMPGSVTFDRVQVVSNFGVSGGGSFFVTISDMKVNPADNTILVVYAPYLSGGPNRNLYFVRSTNGGSTFSAPSPISSDSLAVPYRPRILCGPGAGDVTVAWTQSNATGGFDVYARRSSNGGASFLLPQLAMTFPKWEQRSPAGGFDDRVAGVVQRFGTSAGSTLIGVPIPFELGQDVFPSLGSAPAISEVEPDGTAATATLASDGAVLRGAISASNDADFFAFDLAPGQEVNTWGDSLPAAPSLLELDWFGPDGTSALTAGNLQPSEVEHNGFVAPAAGRYFLRVMGSTGSYRLRTVAGTHPLPGARDQRDLAFSRLPSGGAWTGSQLLTTNSPIGFDEDGLVLADGVDGGLFATYNDYSVTPGRAISRRVLRRSIDGGVTWSAPVAISGANTDWAVTVGFDPFETDLSADDGVNLYSVWTDGRNGDTDVYCQRIERRIYEQYTGPLSVYANPGQVVHAPHTVRNADVFESFAVQIDPIADGWTLPSTQATLAAGETASLDCTFPVPGNAPPGDKSVILHYHSVDSGIVLGIDSVIVHVTAQTAVGPEGARELALAPVRPNPTSGPCELRWSLPRAEHVRLAIYGLDGRLVHTLVDGERAAGEQSAQWNGADAGGSRTAAGEYFVVLDAEGRRLTRRMVVLR